eukprot:3990272-Amphidinium_carterae.1
MYCLQESDEDEFAEDNGWISWFCGLKGHEFFVEVGSKATEWIGLGKSDEKDQAAYHRLALVDLSQYVRRLFGHFLRTFIYLRWYGFTAVTLYFGQAEVEDDYIRDNFNLYGLRGQFAFYDHSLEMILSTEAPDEADSGALLFPVPVLWLSPGLGEVGAASQDDFSDAEFLEIYRSATDLYGLIHARYIVSPRGLQ